MIINGITIFLTAAVCSTLNAGFLVLGFQKIKIRKIINHIELAISRFENKSFIVNLTFLLFSINKSDITKRTLSPLSVQNNG